MSTGRGWFGTGLASTTTLATIMFAKAKRAKEMENFIILFLCEK